MYDENRGNDFSERSQQDNQQNRNQSNNYNRYNGGNNDNYRRNDNYNNGNNGGYKNNFRPRNNNWNGNQRPKEPELDRIYKSFAVAFNKELPIEVQKSIIPILQELEKHLFTCRVAPMEPVDKEIINTIKLKEIILPWRNFAEMEEGDSFVSNNSKTVARLTMPGYDDLKPGLQLILAKNARLLLGKEGKSPTSFLICWSKDGAEKISQKTPATGNIGHLLSIAQAACIPVFNLGKQDSIDRLKNFIGLNSNEQEQKYKSPPIEQSHRSETNTRVEPTVSRNTGNNWDSDDYFD